MSSETTTSPTAADPKQTANNIVKGISDRANGKAPLANTVDPKAPDTPPDPNSGKEKYVVDGKEVWLTPQERTVWVQKGMGYEPKVDQLARLQRETIQFQEALINDPLSILKNIAKARNIPIETLYEKVLDGDWPDAVKEVVGKRYYHNAVEPLKLSPEELEARENKKKLSTYEQQEKSRAEMALRQENTQRVQQAMNQIKANIAEAMKDSGLPNNDSPLGVEMARMVADVMRVAQFQRKSITPKQAIEYVKQHRIKAFQSSYYDSLEGDALVKELGDANVEKIKKYLLKTVQENGASLPKVTKSAPRPGERKTISSDDMHDYLEQRKREG